MKNNNYNGEKDVFDRLKKRPANERIPNTNTSHLEMDLETLIRKEGVNKGNYGNLRDEDIHKRIKKA